MNAHRPVSGQPEPGGPLFSQNNFYCAQVFTAPTSCHSDEVSGGKVKILVLLARYATPSCQIRKNYVVSTVPVLRMAARRAAKTRKLATFCEKSCKIGI